MIRRLTFSFAALSLVAAFLVGLSDARAWLIQRAVSGPGPGADGVGTAQYGSNNSTAPTVYLTTANPNDLIVAIINFDQNNTQSVSSVTSTSGLTWTFRGAIDSPTAPGAQPRLEVWTAPASAALSGETITFNINSYPISYSALIAFGVTGLSSISAPMDGNASLPATASALLNVIQTPSVSGLSTSNAGTDMLLFLDGCKTGTANLDPGAAPTGFTFIAKSGVLGGQYNEQPTYVYYKLVTGAQSSLTITDSGTWPSLDSGWVAIGTALVVD